MADELKITRQLLDSTNKKLALEEQHFKRLKVLYDRKDAEIADTNK